MCSVKIENDKNDARHLIYNLNDKIKLRHVNTAKMQTLMPVMVKR